MNSEYRSMHHGSAPEKFFFFFYLKRVDNFLISPPINMLWNSIEAPRRGAS